MFGYLKIIPLTFRVFYGYAGLMFTPIEEPILVGGVYTQSSFLPRVFLWRQRKYPVNKITLISDIKDGAVRQRVYSVLSGEVLYRLLFDREKERWQLLAMANN